MATAQKLKESLVTKKVNLEVMIAKKQDELKDEEEYKASITPDCDWILKAFAERAEKRAAELEGLFGAKEYLVGYKPSLLERRATKAFDDDKLPGLKFLALQ